jgi:hypothetical protein
VIQDRSYRLSHCAGFAVFDPGGRIGVVSDLVFRSRSDRPDVLLVRRRFRLRRTLGIPVEQVVDVDLERRRVHVHGAPVGVVEWQQPATEEVEQAAVAQARQT